MSVCKAYISDLDTALDIYACAREFMKKSGNPEQWGDFYPTREIVLADIESGSLYMLTDEHSGDVYGVFAFFPNGDKIYDTIDGAWQSEAPHGAVHRVASDGTHRGVLRECMEFCRESCTHIRIDTHPSNTPMRSALMRLGFSECGSVYVPPVGRLLAFEIL